MEERQSENKHKSIDRKRTKRVTSGRAVISI